MANRNWSKQTLLRRTVEVMKEQNMLADPEATVDMVVDGHCDDDLTSVTMLEFVTELKDAIVKDAMS